MKLQFTNGYRPRFDQISRILQFLLTQAERKKIPHQAIVGALGVPSNQVDNLISMMTGFGLVNPRLTTLTPFGNAVVQKDPYFEKIETLWIIHYRVSSNPEWVVWHRIINLAIPTQDRLTVEQVSEKYFSDLSIQFSENTISEKLRKEVGATLATYTRAALSRLNILEQEKKGTFIRSTPVEIPVMALLFCMIYYRDQRAPGSSALNTGDIGLAENSPGRVLNLPEYPLRAMLGELHHAGLIRLEQFANLDQARIPVTTTQESTLHGIYGS